MTKTRKLRELIGSPHITRVSGAHNPLGAKLIESAGFPAIWSSGLEISAAQALPDANILTMTEFLEAASSMSDAVDIPVIADCDTGFGNSNNVIHMVKRYEKAGIAAVCIEDKRFPKMNSFIPGRQELATIAEFVGRIMAAKNAQSDPDFMVIARIEAFIAGQGIEEALKRGHAYADAGADAILIHSKSQKPDEIYEFAARWDRELPLVAIPTTYYNVTTEELEKAGFAVVIYANQGMRAALRAMRETFEEIYRAGTSRTVETEIASLQEIFEIQDIQGMKDAEKLYMHTGHQEVVAVIPAAGEHLEEYSMKEISSDIPIAALDINGKTLLQKQVETLNRSGIQEIHVIGGYKKDRIDAKNVHLLENIEYENTGMLHSIMCARDFIQGKVFVVYGDILFDRVLLEELLQVEEDIVILVDPNYDAKKYGSEKKIDLVISEGRPIKTKRRLRETPLSKVLKIGLDVNPSEAHYEFPGLMALSPRGSEIVKEVYESASKRYGGKPFHSAPNFERAVLADLLQEIVNAGHPVVCMESDSGWLEVHSMDDYKLACSMTR